MKILISVLLFFLSIQSSAQPQFISKMENRFIKGDSDFYFLGYGVYYLQWMASDSSRKYIVDDVFRTAQQTGIKVIRTWAFNSGTNINNPACLRYGPYELREEGLRALDYVVYKASQYNIHLILTLENNFNDFGGIKKYLDWADVLLKPLTGKVYKHNDFFTDDSIKSWYKYYIKQILERENVFTITKYKDEPAVFSYELINEASNAGFDNNIIKNWYEEMAEYFKSIDNSHLLSTGEEGYDSYRQYYSDWDYFYNSSRFLFDGYKGTSFYENSSLTKIDYSTFHLYPDAWGFDRLAGNTWINDHTLISSGLNKPSLPGEFGIRSDKLKFYKTYLETIRNTPSRSAVLWDYLHPDLSHFADEYAFNELDDPDLFLLFKEHIQKIDQDPQVNKETSFILYQNYPNPFNPATTIEYNLNTAGYVKIELYNSVGELLKVIEEGIKPKGDHKLFLSVNEHFLSSGVYFCRIKLGALSETIKIMLMK